MMVWFYTHVDTLGRLMRKVTAEQRREEGLDVDEDDDEEEVVIQPFNILCSSKYNSTENRICVMNNPTECQSELFSILKSSQTGGKCFLKVTLFSRKLE